MRTVLAIATACAVAACGSSADDSGASAEQGVVPDDEVAFDPDGSMQFEVIGDEMIAVGVIDGSTPGAFADAIAAHPDVTTLLLSFVPGSADDEANLRLARDVRGRSLLTVVPAEGLVASGGTDLFLAGADREIDPGACLGVHSWSAGDFEGTDLPRDDPEHDRYLDYYAEIGIDGEFYWFTLEAAPAAGMYWMNAGDMAEYGMVTAGSAATATAAECESRL